MQEEALVTGSVTKLSVAHAASLLNAIVERVQHEPQQAARLVVWLRSVLLTHGPVLAATQSGQVSRRHTAAWRVLLACGCSAARHLAMQSHDAPPAALAPQATLRLTRDLLDERTSNYAALVNLSGRLQVLQAAGSSDGSTVGVQAATAKVGVPF